MKNITLFLLLFTSLSLAAQNFQGKIIDSLSTTGIPLAKVSIKELGTSQLTDVDGTFTFTNSLPDFITLIVSATGYESRSLILNSTVSNLQIKLVESHVELEGVQILAARDGLQRDNATFVISKDLKELNIIKATNLGDAISALPGVYTATTGTGISKPVIRGLSGTRVVTFLNGIRIENQQWGGDHGMGVTALGIGKVEVIKGPASLLFGSDALGGVLYFSDEEYAKNGRFEEQVSSSFESNGLNSQTSIGLKFSERKIRINVFAGLNSAADFRLPNSAFLRNSRYEDQLLKTAIGFGKGNWVSNIRYTFQRSYVGIPGETEDSIPTPLSFQSSSSIRKRDIPFQFIENNFISWENKFFFNQNELNITVGNTNNSLNEFEDNSETPGLSMNLNSTIYTLKYKWYITKTIKLISGIQGMYQTNKNKPDAEERLIPNATTIDNGLFSILDFKLGKTIFQTGIRGDFRNITVQDDSIQFNKNFPSLNFSAGFVRAIKKSTFRFNVSSGFRSPHTSELLANGAHDGALRYEIGTDQLKNEQATQFDLTYEYSNEHISLIVNPFYNNIKNYIYIQPIDSTIENLPVFAYGQANNVSLYGTDLGIHYHPHQAHWLHIESNYSWVRGQQQSGSSLPLIPQSRIQTDLKFELEMKSKFKIDNLVLQHQYYFNQDRITSYETVTSDYNLINLGANLSWTGKTKIDFTVGVKNCLNASYNNHLSTLKNIGIPSPGRNFYLGVKLNLEQKVKK